MYMYTDAYRAHLPAFLPAMYLFLYPSIYTTLCRSLSLSDTIWCLSTLYCTKLYHVVMYGTVLITLCFTAFYFILSRCHTNLHRQLWQSAQNTSTCITGSGPVRLRALRWGGVPCNLDQSAPSKSRSGYACVCIYAHIKLCICIYVYVYIYTYMLAPPKIYISVVFVNRRAR